jgi:hypothetical protein
MVDKMKYTTKMIVLVAVCGAALLAAVGAGLYIRQARLQRATAEPNDDSAMVNGEEDPSKFLPGQGLRGRKREFSPEQRAQRKKEREEIIKKMENMSEQEKEEFLAQMRQKFDRTRTRPRRPESLSQDEINELRQQFEGLRERWRNMSEEEKEAFRARMRERFGSRRRPSEEPPTDLPDEETKESPGEPNESGQ